MTLMVEDAFGAMTDSEKYITTQFFKMMLQTGVFVHTNHARKILEDIIQSTGFRGIGLSHYKDEPMVGLIQHSQTNTSSFLISCHLWGSETRDQRISVEEADSLAEFTFGIPSTAELYGKRD